MGRGRQGGFVPFILFKVKNCIKADISFVYKLDHSVRERRAYLK
jgi:hypothetical protein